MKILNQKLLGGYNDTERLNVSILNDNNEEVEVEVLKHNYDMQVPPFKFEIEKNDKNLTFNISSSFAEQQELLEQLENSANINYYGKTVVDLANYMMCRNPKILGSNTITKAEALNEIYNSLNYYSHTDDFRRDGKLVLDMSNQLKNDYHLFTESNLNKERFNRLFGDIPFPDKLLQDMSNYIKDEFIYQINCDKKFLKEKYQEFRNEIDPGSFKSYEEWKEGFLDGLKSTAYPEFNLDKVEQEEQEMEE